MDCQGKMEFDCQMASEIFDEVERKNITLMSISVCNGVGQVLKALCTWN